VGDVRTRPMPSGGGAVVGFRVGHVVEGEKCLPWLQVDKKRLPAGGERNASPPPSFGKSFVRGGNLVRKTILKQLLQDHKVTFEAAHIVFLRIKEES